MREYKVTVTQTTPSGDVKAYDLDVIGTSEDGALAMVYSWYDQHTHYLNETKDLPQEIPLVDQIEADPAYDPHDPCGNWKEDE